MFQQAQFLANQKNAPVLNAIPVLTPIKNLCKDSRNKLLTIKILGSGCSNCKRLEAITRKVVEKHHLDAEIIKVTDYHEIMKFPILATPGLVLDETVMSAGRIPSESEIENWLIPTI